MKTNKKSVLTPKTVGVKPTVTKNMPAISSTISFTCDAVIKFENDILSAPRTIDMFTGRMVRVCPKGLIQGLKEGAQSYYDRALLAESKCKTSLYSGLAGGAIIGASIVGLIVLVCKRKEKRQIDNQ